MTGLNWLDEQVAAAAQIRPEDLVALASTGVTTLVNHRPDDEEPGQPPGQALAAKAAELGLDYIWIPVRGAPDAVAIAATADVLESAKPEARFVFFCRSGFRSAAAWAGARRLQGAEAGDLRARAAAAGYDLSRLAL